MEVDKIGIDEYGNKWMLVEEYIDKRGKEVWFD